MGLPLIQSGYFLLCFTTQFDESLRKVKFLLAGTLTSSLLAMLISLLGHLQWPEWRSWSWKVWQGGFLGAYGFGLLGFYLLTLFQERQKHRERVAFKLPLLGLLWGIFLSRFLNPSPLFGKLAFFLPFILIFLVLGKVKSTHPLPWRSFSLALAILLFGQILGLLVDWPKGSWTLSLVEGLTWIMAHFFLFQSINYFLVRSSLYQKLVVGAQVSLDKEKSR